MNVNQLRVRSQVLKAIRTWFEQMGFTEVMIPVFHTALPLEPNIYAFTSDWKSPTRERTFYLTTSPESQLKKALATGLGNCFGIGSCFRNLEGSSSRHSPEFMMLEWYRTNAEYRAIMADAKELILFVKQKLDQAVGREPNSVVSYKGQQLELNQEWPVLSLVELFRRYAYVEIEEIIDDALISVAEHKGYVTEETDWGQLFDQIFLNEIEPHLPTTPFFLTDFPARISPLCKVSQTRPYLAERFEVYLAGMELGNGNTENLDATVVQKSFIEEANSRQLRGQSTHPYDHEFVKAIEQLSQTGELCAGIGLGIDRLIMILGDFDTIQDFYLP